MAARIEYSPAEDGYLVPSDAETIERSNLFARQLQEVAHTLDTFFCPDYREETWRVPFGRWSDGNLVIFASDMSGTPMLKLGYAHPEEGFLLHKTQRETAWHIGTQTGTDAAIARTLDANWPLTLDNSAIRTLTDRGGAHASFDSIRDTLLGAARTEGTLESSEHTFIGSWLWNDDGRTATGSATVTVSDIDGEKRYAFSIVLPHEHGDHDRANVTCTARLDGQYGLSYDIKSDDPELTRLHLALPAIIDSLDYYLEAFVEARISRAAEALLSD